MQHFLCLERPDWAIAQYRHCHTVLAREFGVEPMPQTQRLYQRVLAQQQSVASPTLAVEPCEATALAIQV